MALAIPLLVPALAVAGGTGRGASSESARQLDQKKVHYEYNEGNFDVVLASLEGFQSANRTYGREDSIFIAKHLAVVYTANPQTREKGKYYMNRLLELVPSAKLVDMYVSEEIDRIFDKVREEFLSRQQGFGVDASMIQLPDKAPGQHPQSADAGGTGGNGSRRDKKGAAAGKGGGKAWFWIAAGTGMAGAVTYYLMHPSRGSDKTYVVQ